MSGTLYLTDLDGTLLGCDQRVSAHSCAILNRLTEKGLLLSCATARSRYSSLRVLAGLELRLPMITHNGTFIQDCADGRILHGHFLPRRSVTDITDWYYSRGIFPVVYAIIDGAERFSYVPELSCRALTDFVATRKGDPRLRPIGIDRLCDGDVYYITAMGDESILAEAHTLFSARSELNCLLYPEIYSGDLWLEIMPAAAGKANAALRLRDMLGCDRLVCFGDGENDIHMFRIADECYAMSNAAPELKAIATGVIGSNSEDAVALWLERNAGY